MKTILLILFIFSVNFGFTQEIIPTKKEALTIAMNHEMFDVFMKKAKVSKEVNVQMNEIIMTTDTLKKGGYVFTNVENCEFECLTIGDFTISKKSSFRIMFDYSQKNRKGNKQIIYNLGMYFKFQNNRWELVSHTIFKNRWAIKK